MRAGAKPVAAIALVSLLGGVLSSCDTSSPAAIVNGQAITQAQLNQYLEAWADSPAYVSSFDETAEEQYSEQVQEAESEGESAQDVAPPTLVEGGGTGPAVYGMQWATTEIRLLITEVAVQQYLAKHHEAPTPDEVAASFASQYAVDPAVWLQVTAQARNGSAEWVADHALVDTKASNPKEDKQFYEAELSYFWSQVCVSTVDISVGDNGQINLAASKKQADAVASELSGGKGGAQPPVTSGARYCLTPEQAIEQPEQFRDLLGKLAPGQAAPIPESFGYEVVKVISRNTIPYSNQVGAIIDIVAVTSQTNTSDPKVNSILSAAKVEFNPAYPGL
jgi:TusA-related sulfurtransferase